MYFLAELERQRAETERALTEEKRGKEYAALYSDSFVFRLVGTLSGLEKEVCTLKRDLATVRRPIPI